MELSANDPPTLHHFRTRASGRSATSSPAFGEDADVPGSLVMFDMTHASPGPSRDWLYNGKGVWTVGVAGDSPVDQGDLEEL